MSVAAVANQPTVWERVGPYVVPLAHVAGVTFIVSQVWGRVAAAAFLGVTIAASFAFPSIRDQITKNDLVSAVARAVVLVALTFFGFKGVIVAVGVAAISGVFQDLRMFQIRARLAAAETLIKASNTKLADLTRKRDELIAACNKKCEDTEAKLKTLAINEDAARKTIDALEQKLVDYQAKLKTMLNGFTFKESDLEFANTLLKNLEVNI